MKRRTSVLDPAFFSDITDLVQAAATVEEFIGSVQPGQAIGKDRMEELIILLRKARQDVLEWIAP